MMRIVQSIAIGAIGSEYFDDRVGKRYAAFEGIVYDLGQIAACLDRIEAMLTGEVARDDLALAAYTWLAVMMYARCFDGCGFHASRSPIPSQAGHPFHAKPVTDSTASRSGLAGVMKMAQSVVMVNRWALGWAPWWAGRWGWSGCVERAWIRP